MKTNKNPRASWPVMLGATALLFTACQKQDDLAPTASEPASTGTQNLGVVPDAIAYWKFDGDATDAVGSSNGTAVGATYGPGINGQALVLDGTGYVDVPGFYDDGRDDGTGTISMWVKTTQSSGRLLFNTSQNSAGTTLPMYLGLSNGKAQLYFGGFYTQQPEPGGPSGLGTSVVLTGQKRIDDGSWHHVLARWIYPNLGSGAGIINLYVDGKQALANVENDGFYTDFFGFNFVNPIRLGGSLANTGFFKGSLDDVSIYPRYLEGTEIKALAARSLNPQLEFIVDNTDPGFSTTGTWTASSGLKGFFGSNYLHDGDAQASPNDAATWASPITSARAGTYEVYMRWTATADRPAAAPVQVTYRDGVKDLTVNQEERGGEWVLIGVFPFSGRSGESIRLSAAAGGYTIADAVRFVETVE